MQVEPREGVAVTFSRTLLLFPHTCLRVKNLFARRPGEIPLPIGRESPVAVEGQTCLIGIDGKQATRALV